MKRSLIASLLISTQFSTFAMELDSGAVVKEFANTVLLRMQNGSIKDQHEGWDRDYAESRELALSDNTLRRCPLEIKYNLISSIFTQQKKTGVLACEPALVAQEIFNSFGTTHEASPEIVLPLMRTFMKHVYPITFNLSIDKWRSYTLSQARNKSLPYEVREDSVHLYTELTKSFFDNQKFMYKLLLEIEQDKLEKNSSGLEKQRG